jgi:molybdate transport system ATP-binding protein
MLRAAIAVRLGGFRLACELEVEAGRAVSVVGASGAGKTTLLRCLAGLVRPDEGFIGWQDAIWFDARRRLHVPPQGRDCGMVFAEYALFPHMTALDNAAFGLQAQGLHARAARRRAGEVLAELGIEHLARRRAGSLSSGEQQRVALARALVCLPRVLLLDEPLSAIDVERRPPVREVIRRAILQNQGAAVIVTHDPIEAMLFAETICVMEHGQVVQRGSPADLRERPASAYVAAFCGVNCYRGIARPSEDGISVVDVDGASITVSGRWSGPVACVVDPDAVVVSRTPVDSSARNSFRGTITSLVPDGAAVRVAIAGTPPIVARVTRRSADELGLAPGVDVVATFKATEVHVS